MKNFGKDCHTYAPIYAAGVLYNNMIVLLIKNQTRININICAEFLEEISIILTFTLWYASIPTTIDKASSC